MNKLYAYSVSKMFIPSHMWKFQRLAPARNGRYMTEGEESRLSALLPSTPSRHESLRELDAKNSGNTRNGNMRPSQILELNRQAVRNLAAQYKEKGITNFRIIGSVADGTDTENSDIDFLVDAEDHVDLFTVGGLYSALEELLKTKIDIVLSDEIHPYFKHRIINGAKII